MERAAPFHRFAAFIGPGADRLGVLTALLDELGLVHRTLQIDDTRHLLVSPGQRVDRGTASRKKPVVLVAHYDRTADSPGANDNSAAVFQLIEAAMTLRTESAGNWFIIFTDKEELGQHEGLVDQGAYRLARRLRETSLGGGRFYIFDVCGAGDTLIISTMTDHLTRNEGGEGIARARRLAQRLRDQALETARNLNMGKVLLAPTPFSDDAGFLRAGIAAQTITVLPSEEAARLASLRHNAAFINALVSREARTPQTASLLPETWQRINGPGDSPQLLTPRYYDQVVRFARALCGA